MAETPKRTPIISQAPAFNQGVQPLDVKDMLARATPEQLSALYTDSFALWAQYAGLEVDNRSFDFDKHRYLLPLYMDNSQELTLIKAAQMGATIYQILFLLWWARYHTVKVGMYFPTADGVGKLSKDRLGPLIKSNDDLRRHVVDDGDTLGLKQFENIHGKISSIYMLYMGGQASKDSVPLDVVVFDEVRLIEPKDIDQALQRISHSNYKIKRFMSTAGSPNDDIDARYQRGKQYVWHVKCSCPDGFVPSEVFPDCIVATEKEVYLRCPRCQMRIYDPQIGNYVAHNPRADFPSYSISQLISAYRTPKEIWNEFLTTTNMSEFYNAVLGRPYVDERNQPVSLDVLHACVNPTLKWAYQDGAAPAIKKKNAMGVDQGGGYLYVNIMGRNQDGKKQLRHFEIIESANPRYWENGKQVSPFKRLYELMTEFDIGIAVVDNMPNYNEAADFARAFPGRVFLAHYGEMGVDMVKWHDRLKPKEQIRKGSKEIKLKHQVTINRYTGIDYMLQEFVDRDIEIPPPDALVQVVRNTESGRFEAENLVRSRYFMMLSSLIRQQKELDAETGRWKMEWKYLRGDPHAAHAQLYCTIAVERMKKLPSFVF